MAAAAKQPAYQADIITMKFCCVFCMHTAHTQHIECKTYRVETKATHCGSSIRWMIDDHFSEQKL
jgi:hypothetical protein